jgi:hypothetical protein
LQEQLLKSIQAKVPLYLRFIIFNVALLGFLLFTGRLRADRPSIWGAVAAFGLMNLVAWRSSRHYKEWK